MRRLVWLIGSQPARQSLVPFCAFSGLVLSTLKLQLSLRTTFALDRPIYLAILVLLSTACLAILAKTYLDCLYDRSHALGATTTPFQKAPTDSVLRRNLLVTSQSSLYHLRHKLGDVIRFRNRSYFGLLLVVVLVCRALSFHKATVNVQYTVSGLYLLLPPIISILDLISGLFSLSYASPALPSIGSSRRHGPTKLLRGFLLVIAFGLLGHIVQRQSAAPASTYILTHPHPRLPTVTWQLLGVSLDVFLLYRICLTFQQLQHQQHQSLTSALSALCKEAAWITATASIILLIGVGLYIKQLPTRLRWTTDLSWNFVISALTLDMTLCFFLMSFCASIYSFSLLVTLTLAILTVVAAQSISNAWAACDYLFIPTTDSAIIFIIFVWIALATLHFWLAHDRHDNRSQTPRIKSPIVLSSIAAGFVIVVAQFLPRLMHLPNDSGSHPVTRLMLDAQTHHTQYLKQASASDSLSDAGREYSRRYGLPPPPHFDQWYQFAKTRESVIIDDFDSVHNDLLPFWSLSPQELRERTRRLISTQNGICGLLSRDGLLFLAPGCPDDHKWMLDGIIKMINTFVRTLPEMDIAFNINDEPRVLTPYVLKQSALDDARRAVGSVRPASQTYGYDSKQGWRSVNEIHLEPVCFDSLSKKRGFFEFGNAGCPPQSAAKRARISDIGKFCTDCAQPHSSGAFLANWTLSGDVCHQPDLADLHGYFMAPTAHFPTHELMPVFSQSKIPSFDDILFPSPWNYVDKIAYEPTSEQPDLPFAQKRRALFWRGSTTESWSETGLEEWRACARQRMTHLASHALNEDAPPQPVLIPTSPVSDSLAYSYVSPHVLSSRILTDVEIVSIERCTEIPLRCLDQIQLFKPNITKQVDFQRHWAYKYLLDLDGAGFSGRLLPFLFSRSLPFKTGIFREWYDSRLSPWMHFVPLDIRGQGLWATLLFFAGIESDAKDLGQLRYAKAHDEDAELIADAGRKWAGQVLRKEDMEVYMYRLLLEWARLTDDRRDELGYSV